MTATLITKYNPNLTPKDFYYPSWFKQILFYPFTLSQVKSHFNFTTFYRLKETIDSEYFQYSSFLSLAETHPILKQIIINCKFSDSPTYSDFDIRVFSNDISKSYFYFNVICPLDLIIFVFNIYQFHLYHINCLTDKQNFFEKFGLSGITKKSRRFEFELYKKNDSITEIRANRIHGLSFSCLECLKSNNRLGSTHSLLFNFQYLQTWNVNSNRKKHAGCNDRFLTTYAINEGPKINQFLGKLPHQVFPYTRKRKWPS